MSNYYLYRINPAYDGFYPSTIAERTQRGRFIFNWGAYLDNLERGDVVLVHFIGKRCVPGIYAITKIVRVNHARERGNVLADLLIHSTDNKKPLFAQKDNQELFSRLMYRPRGAELVVAAPYEREVFDLLNSNEALLARLVKFGFSLPRVTIPGTFDVTTTPAVDLAQDLSNPLVRKGIVAAFWIRPKQASWLRSIEWLTFISQVFYKYKSGDTSYLSGMAQRLAEAINRQFLEEGIPISAIVSVPLAEEKRARGEIDRVAALCVLLQNILGIQYVDALRLTGNVSRVRYKRLGLPEAQFKRDYLTNLSLTSSGRKLLARASQHILLVDDVFTDGVTTSLVQSFLTEMAAGEGNRFFVATLGVMAKTGNVSIELRQKWQN